MLRTGSRISKLAFALFFLFDLCLFGFALVYIVRQEFMPYHAEAAGMAWAQLPAGIRALFYAMQHTLGGSWLALGIAFTAILFGPYRRGEPWARHTLLVVGAIFNILVMASSGYLAAVTAARTPWRWTAWGLGLVVAAWVLGTLETRSSRKGERPPTASADAKS